MTHRMRIGGQTFRVGDKIKIIGEIVEVTPVSLVIDVGDTSPIEIQLSPSVIEFDDVRVGDTLIHYCENPKNKHLLLPVEMKVTNVDHGWVYVDADGLGPFPFDKAVKMFSSRPEPPKQEAKTLWDYIDEQRKKMPRVTQMNETEQSSLPAKGSNQND